MTQSTSDPFLPLITQRSSERVADAIRETIVGGRFRPGDRLPPERTLAKRFRVTRNTIREALRLLEQSRLVHIRQGSGVTVQDYLSTAGLEFLGVLMGSAEGTTESMVRDLLEARAVLGAAILDHALARADLSRLHELGEAVEAFRAHAHSERPDPVTLLALDIQVHDWIVRAGGNRAFVLLYNSLRRIYQPVAHLFAPALGEPAVLARSYGEAHAALARGDREQARRIFAGVFASARPGPAQETA